MLKLAVVGIFYDGYYDLWEDFIKLLSMNWPDCPYPVYIVNGTKEVNFSKEHFFSVLHSGDEAEYSYKVKTAIENIDADYYLLLLEDFFFEQRISANVLERTIESMKKNNIKYLRMPISDFLDGNEKRKYQYDKASGFYLIPEKSEYTVSCQPSIWEKSFLSSCIGKGNYNAWIFEGMYSFSKKAHSREFLNKCRIDFDNMLCLRHGVVQGKMLPNVYADFKRLGYLFKNKREIMNNKMYKNYRRKKIFKSIVPLFIQRLIKCSIYDKSVFKKYKNDITVQMKENNLG